MTEETEQKEEIKSFDDLGQVNESEKGICICNAADEKFYNY